mmetsp:Transcript_124101/g.175072  ORF Transcript_124101/g.175072 Transcript_124101/m.175072 type:complete len:122 (+) Transcript_124101:1-366(+)
MMGVPNVKINPKRNGVRALVTTIGCTRFICLLPPLCCASRRNFLYLARYMSAVCYLYGREIQAKTNMPVGLVNTNWGGTPVEFWSSADSLNKCANSSGRSGGAYNGMIVPLLNMTIYGAIW